MRKKKSFFMILIVLIVFISGCSNISKPSGPPDATAMLDGKEVELEKGGYHWEEVGLFSNKVTVADAAAPFQIAEQLKAQPVSGGSIVTIAFSDDSKPQLSAYLWEGERRGKALPLKKAEVTLPSQSGRHVIELTAKWGNGDASYTFVIEVP